VQLEFRNSTAYNTTQKFVMRTMSVDRIEGEDNGDTISSLPASINILCLKKCANFETV